MSIHVSLIGALASSTDVVELLILGTPTTFRRAALDQPTSVPGSHWDAFVEELLSPQANALTLWIAVNASNPLMSDVVIRRLAELPRLTLNDVQPMLRNVRWRYDGQDYLWTAISLDHGISWQGRLYGRGGAAMRPAARINEAIRDYVDENGLLASWTWLAPSRRPV